MLMYKSFLPILLLSMIFSTAAAMPAKVLMANSKWLEVDLLTADKAGNLKVKLDRKEIIIKRQDFIRVAMEPPRELAEARQMFAARKTQDAAKIAMEIAEKYNFPPLGLEIKLLQAQIKTSEQDYEGVIALLSPQMDIKTAESVPQVESIHRACCLLLLGDAFNKLSQDDEARKAYRQSFELAVPEYSAQANLALGKMLLAENNFAEALQCFLENIVVFSAATPGRKESLRETVKIYKKKNDKNYKIFEEMLKKEYPE